MFAAHAVLGDAARGSKKKTLECIYTHVHYAEQIGIHVHSCPGIPCGTFAAHIEHYCHANCCYCCHHCTTHLGPFHLQHTQTSGRICRPQLFGAWQPSPHPANVCHAHWRCRDRCRPLIRLAAVTGRGTTSRRFGIGEAVPGSVGRLQARCT